MHKPMKQTLTIDGKLPGYNEDDGWYSWVPDNEFFCFYGERKEGKA